MLGDSLADADKADEDLLEVATAVILDHLGQALAVRVEEVLLDLYHVHLRAAHDDAHEGVAIRAKPLGATSRYPGGSQGWMSGWVAETAAGRQMREGSGSHAVRGQCKFAKRCRQCDMAQVVRCRAARVIRCGAARVTCDAV